MTLEKMFHLVAAAPKPATWGEIQAALGASSHISKLEIAVAINPGSTNNDVMGLAIGGH